MEIDKLIAQLKEMAEWAEANEWETPIMLSDILYKAEKTISLLWEVAKDTSNEKYKMVFDDTENYNAE